MTDAILACVILSKLYADSGHTKISCVYMLLAAAFFAATIWRIT